MNCLKSLIRASRSIGSIDRTLPSIEVPPPCRCKSNRCVVLRISGELLKTQNAADFGRRGHSSIDGVMGPLPTCFHASGDRLPLDFVRIVAIENRTPHGVPFRDQELGDEKPPSIAGPATFLTPDRESHALHRQTQPGSVICRLVRALAKLPQKPLIQ